MIIEAVLENQIIGALESIEGAEDYQIIGSRTIPEDGETKSEDNDAIGVIAVSVGYRNNDNFSLPMLSIPVTLQICTRTEEDATGSKHETFVSSLASKLSFWHLHGDMMTARFSSQKFLAGELTLTGGSGRSCDSTNKCWSENVTFTIRGSERFSDDEYSYDIDWSKVNNPPSLNGAVISSNTTLDEINVYSKDDVDVKIDEVRREISSISDLSSDIEIIKGEVSSISDLSSDIVEIKREVSSITSISNDVEDIKDDIEIVKGEVSSINQFAQTNISTLSSNVSNLSSNLISTENELADVKRDIVETNEKVDTLSTSVGNTKFDVTQIKSKIPSDATLTNKLASQAFVNSSINNFAAYYITKNANGDAFQTYAELSSATKFYNGGEERIPTKNDYLVILEDETKTTALSVNPTTRYTYQGVFPDGQWEYQYIVNNTSLTQSQVDAINSTITKEMVELRVYPSTVNPHYAANSDWAETAAIADYANTAALADLANSAYQSELSYNAEHANNADYASTALYATQADQALTASFAYNCDLAVTANYSLTAETAIYADSTGFAHLAQNASWAQTADYATNTQDSSHAQLADTADYATLAGGVQGYTETLLSGVTEDDTPVTFYILTK